ncbi:iron chaperone [Leuconostoc pseudomesenteroides]|uniref:YdhG-like domain-containing protein n=1 Tax=Leuconostoc pseudomesenteroides TaxID=33968 RepID=A0ABT6HCH9_LEUPS|nr:hypothetical protein [Leuconostoc pseudomesenteroides]MDG9733793.1 hypothetical protein [Leuconostoc pseudomesenteroides]NKZ36293.1 hypothetical protein [Leuconostoc pseudomesenteroides]QQB27586.1 hypothetical protein I6H60_00825 [Leuconostoc pseudomesenteroides]
MAQKETFSEFERQAMRKRAKELKKAKNTEADVLEKIAEMTDEEVSFAMTIHDIVKRVAPELKAKTWYGMPAYANADGKVVIFFQAATKFKARYSTIGFNDTASLDEGNLWTTSFAISAMTNDVVAKLTVLIKRSISGNNIS